MAFWGQLTLQDAATPIINQLTSLHDHAILIVLLVVSFVSYTLYNLISSQFYCRKQIKADTLETIWTVTPAFILLFLAIPSLRLLYLIDEIPNPQLTFKAIGHQWYWSYEYLGVSNLEFNSYIIPTTELNPGIFRLLEVDHRAVVPIKTETQLLITSADVIHSWALPRLGVKVDAIPGRQNQVGFSTTNPGVFYGQCSEICGTDHSFIPIALEAVNLVSFISWIKSS